MNTERIFLRFSVDKLRQCEGRIQTCLDLLTPEQIAWRNSEESNSIANLVFHLSGNVRQWIVASVGGGADLRDRDAEFAARGHFDTADLRTMLSKAVEQALQVIEQVTPERLVQPVRVQGYEKTVLEAIYHVVEHFSMHTGQIIYVTKMLSKQDLGFHRHLTTKAAHAEKTP